MELMMATGKKSPNLPKTCDVVACRMLLKCRWSREKGEPKIQGGRGRGKLNT